jgi:glycine betaine/proline transport system substrate-binding protein
MVASSDRLEAVIKPLLDGMQTMPSFVYLIPALAASMETAYKRSKPWLGYYWAPTWVLGRLDMVQLEEPKFDPNIWETTKACEYPAVKCDIIVHKSLPQKAPEVVRFLKQYETTLEINNKFLAYMRDNKASTS